MFSRNRRPSGVPASTHLVIFVLALIFPILALDVYSAELRPVKPQNEWRPISELEINAASIYENDDHTVEYAGKKYDHMQELLDVIEKSFTQSLLFVQSKVYQEHYTQECIISLHEFCLRHQLALYTYVPVSIARSGQDKNALCLLRWE